MKFVAEPDNFGLVLIGQARKYNDIWQREGRRIITALHELTGLDFKQEVIKAKVVRTRKGRAGNDAVPMYLASFKYTRDQMLGTLFHELCHRLLEGNSLSPVSLGLFGVFDASEDSLEWEHRLIYLFELDAMTKAFGAYGRELCEKIEGRDYNPKSPAHDRAWRWAMSFTFEQRQAMTAWLAAQKVTKAESESRQIKRRKPIDFEKQLVAVAHRAISR